MSFDATQVSNHFERNTIVACENDWKAAR